MENRSGDYSHLPSRPSSVRSYAEVTKQRLNIPIQRSVAKRSSPPCHRRSVISNRCFRCGGVGHLARDCRDPLRCFSCGFTGHKQYRCNYRRSPASIADASTSTCPASASAGYVASTALAQAWCSMIYRDDSSIRQAPIIPEDINNEQLRFNQNYLKLRKRLLAKGLTDSYALVGGLDGLFNSFYKISTTLDMLLESDCDEMVLDDGPLEVSSQTSCDLFFSNARSREDQVFDDLLLLDPAVESCTQKFSTPMFHRPSESIEEEPLSIEETASPVMSSLIEPDEFCAKEVSTSRCSVSFSGLSTDLVLFNKFEILDSNFVEEPLCLTYATDMDVNTAPAFTYNGGSTCCESRETVLGGTEPNEPQTLPVANIEVVVKPTSSFTDQVLRNRSALHEYYTDAVQLGFEWCARASLDGIGPVEQVIPRPLAYVEPSYSDEAFVSTDAAVSTDTLSLNIMPEPSFGGPLDLGRLTEQVYVNTLGYKAEVQQGINEADVNFSCCENDAVLNTSSVKSDTVIINDVGLGDSWDAAAPLQCAQSDALECSLCSPCGETPETSVVTPTSGKRRGRKQKGFYARSAVRRSARLCGSSERTLVTGSDVPESNVMGISDSGSDC